jgi:predicted aspartyl protease
MIAGVVNAGLEATVPLIVRDGTGNDHSIEVFVDTGFNGSLTLPSLVIAAWGLPWRMRGTVTLGDGSTQHFHVHDAIILWHGTIRHISVEAADTHPLIGMSLISGNNLQFEAIPGGRVIIDGLPATAP